MSTPTVMFSLCRLGLERVDELPMIAAWWLANDVADSPAVRELAGFQGGAGWEMDQLIGQVEQELELLRPGVQEEDAYAARWLLDRLDVDARSAIYAGYHLGLQRLAFERLIGLSDAWDEGWAGSNDELTAEARRLLRAIISA